MAESPDQNIVMQLSSLTYESKRDIYQNAFSMGYLSSSELNERLVLISLVALVWQKMKAKNAFVTPLDILLQITKQNKDNSSFYQFLEALSIIVEDLSYGITKFDSCGLKTSQEIINKIKELLNTWIPF